MKKIIAWAVRIVIGLWVTPYFLGWLAFVGDINIDKLGKTGEYLIMASSWLYKPFFWIIDRATAGGGIKQETAELVLLAYTGVLWVVAGWAGWKIGAKINPKNTNKTRTAKMK